MLISSQYDNGWWGFILVCVHLPMQKKTCTDEQGAPYFNTEFGSFDAPNAEGGTTRRLSGSEQSAGTGLGTAGIMLGCMVRRYCYQYTSRISKLTPT